MNDEIIIKNMKTIRDMVRYGTTLLTKTELHYGHGYLNAKEEAVQICMHTLSLSFDCYEEFANSRLLEEEKKDILYLIKERCYTRKPLAYLIKNAPFHGLDFYVDERVIVPRSFIGEILVNDGILPFLVHEPQNILDMCTGSGCLPIIAAHVFVQAHIDAIDISRQALEVAQINLDKYGLNERIDLIQSDIYNSLNADYHKKYDLIISNPPYVSADSMDKLPREYQQEPSIALHGGIDGMDIVKNIISNAKTFLKPKGILIIEIGNEYENIKAAFPKLPLVWIPVSAGEEQVFLVHAKDL